MSRPSSIDRLPPEIKAEIGQLRMRGRTIDEILAHLRTMTSEQTPSRSALGRHMIKMDMLGNKMRRSREVANALVAQLGDAPESVATRLNIELIHAAVLDLYLSFAENDDDEGINDGGREALRGDPKGLMMLAKTLDHLTSASRKNQDYIVLAEKRATELANKAAAATVERIGKARGISAETLAAIKSGIFGVAA